MLALSLLLWIWVADHAFVAVTGTAVSGAAGWSGYFDGTNHLSISTECTVIDCKSVPSSISDAFTFSVFLRPQFDGGTTSNVTLLSLDDTLSISLNVENGEIQFVVLDNLAASWSSNRFVSSFQNLSNSRTGMNLCVQYAVNRQSLAAEKLLDFYKPEFRFLRVNLFKKSAITIP